MTNSMYDAHMVIIVNIDEIDGKTPNDARANAFKYVASFLEEIDGDWEVMSNEVEEIDDESDEGVDDSDEA